MRNKMATATPDRILVAYMAPVKFSSKQICFAALQSRNCTCRAVSKQRYVISFLTEPVTVVDA